MPVPVEWKSYASGVNAAALPLINIRPDELSLMVNATVRNGYADTRPGWSWRPLSFLTPESQYLFERGRYQGSEFFLSDNGNVAVFAVEGNLFVMEPVSGFIRKLEMSDGKSPFSKFSPHVWLRQRAKWMIAQDGLSVPIRSDGFSAEQSLTYQGEPSVPTGTIMVEGWGRLFVVDPSRRRIYASDHEMDPNSSPINFTEATDYYLNNRYFEGPPALGKIMGAVFTPFQDSSTGIGPLVVFFEKGTKAYNVGIPRSRWITEDISQTILPRVGACSFFAYADKGSEIVFRDQDGRIRTIRNAQQLANTGANYPNDFPLWNIIKDEDANLRQYSESCTFDRRTLTLVYPERRYLPDYRFNVVHRGIAVMENEHLSDKQDVWSFWTGMNICGFTVGPVDGQETLLAFCRDNDGVNRIYQLTRDGAYDQMSSPSGVTPKRIQMTLATPQLDFGVPLLPKKYLAAAARLTGLRGELQVCARWQTDTAPPVNWFTHKELNPSCLKLGSDVNCGITEMADGANPRLVFPAAPKDSGQFYKGGFILDVFGPARVEDMGLSVEPQNPTTTTNVTCVAKQLNPARAICEVNPLCYDAFEAPAAAQPDIALCPLT